MISASDELKKNEDMTSRYGMRWFVVDMWENIVRREASGSIKTESGHEMR